MLKQQQHVNVTNIINKQRKEGEVLMGAGSDLMYSSSQMNKISSVFFQTGKQRNIKKSTLHIPNIYS